MKAITYTRYGLPSVLQIQELKRPIPKADEVLIKVLTSSINDWDWGLLRGKPFLNRVLGGLLKPSKYPILGTDVAGIVEAVGHEVIQFKVGDEVYGDLSESGFGAFAEYTCAKEKFVSIKPAEISFEQAAALPHSGLLALQGLIDKGRIQKGHKVLINGAGGGAGPIAIQYAKMIGTEVTAVDSTPKQDMMLEQGADYVIDFTKEDFTKNGKKYDVILSNFSTHSIFAYTRSLNKKGKYIMVGGESTQIFGGAFIGPIISLFSGKNLGILAHRPNEKIDLLGELFKKGIIKPVIDSQFSLDQITEAMEHYGTGKAVGKIIISIRK